ncbi:NAD(P)/FAD-dependent oxidoreductase [Mycolicibacterium baixiangningiae]|uniref:NAD(P)/FAD-dependent oxidoreductase n=1 Tax=Mycolicibacterium baixiangningiae TaxID=2761578 RepID=UPI001867F7BE|nr:FAD-dependent oxidoreductase [Mycolicibacterium baixiangningiae]
MTRRTFVTVGAGQTAAVAARTLRRRGFDGRIVLIGDEPYAPYQRPPLSKEFLAGVDTADSLQLLPADWLTRNDVDIKSGVDVAKIDTSTRTVQFADGGTFAADAVLLATGGRPRRMATEGPRPDLVHYLRSLDDARRLQESLRPGRRLTLIGAGFIGLEIAATARTLGVEVTVVEAAAQPLTQVIGARLGELFTRLHRENGVRIHTGAAVTAVRTTATGVVVELACGTVVEGDLAVVGIGLLPNDGVAAASGLAVDGGIVVDAQGRTSVDNVYAAGDAARRYSPRAGRHVRVEHFDNANKQGIAVANAMLGRDAVFDEANWCWSDQYARNFQFLGAASRHLVIRGDLDALDFTAFYLDGDAICGAFTAERGEDVMVTRELLGRVVDPDILTDEDTDLWDLVTDTEEVVH